MQHFNTGWLEQMLANGIACFFAGMVAGMIVMGWLAKGK
jgi:hypothetical protein